MGTILISALLALMVVNGVYSLWEEHQRGILCDCSGDCAHCKIQCRSNPKYYGTRQTGVPAVERRAVEEALRPENWPLLIRAIRKSRDFMDMVCYWMFNLFGIVTAAGLLYGFGQRLISAIAGFLS